MARSGNGTERGVRGVALVYVRVSRLDEEEKARKVSPAMQHEKATALREVDGLAVEFFEDLDISGKATMNRPGYLALLERLARGDVRYVVAYDQSRITRNVGDLQRFREAIALHGALFIESSTGRVLDPDDEDQELGSNVIGSVDQHYRRKLARRVRDALATKVAHGELVGPVPAGYLRRREILENGKVARVWVEPDPERAPIIRRLFDEYATGQWSFLTLARHLNAERVPLPRAARFRNNRPAAELWTADVLKDLLANPRYAGRVPSRDGRTFPGAYPAIVDGAIWDACERVRVRGRAHHLTASGSHVTRYSLSGILRCGACGSTMSGWTRKADRSHDARFAYVCYVRRVSRACAGPTIAQDELEDDIRAILEVVALPEGFVEEMTRGRAVGADRAPGPSIDGRLARIRELFELGDITREEYLRRRDALHAERAALEAPRETITQQAGTLRTLVDDWAAYDAGARRELVASVLERVIVQADGSLELIPREGWKPFMRAAIGTALVLPPRGVPQERKTGLVRMSGTPRIVRITDRDRILVGPARAA